VPGAGTVPRNEARPSGRDGELAGAAVAAITQGERMSRRRSTAAAVLTAAAALVAGAGSAQAHPVISGKDVPRVTVGHLKAPPTTAQCQTAYGISCYGPKQFEQAYDENPLFARGEDGRGHTIAIVDSFGSPTIQADLKSFDAAFGLKDPPSLQVIQPAGQVPAFDSSNSDMTGWAGETTLDVEYAHAMAPGAKILLVETPTSETEGETGFPEIVRAENYVIDHHMADVISQSFGATEETFKSKASLLSLRGAVKNAARHGVTMLGASGDSGSTDYKLDLETLYDHQVNSWPSSDPLVTSIGGTQLHLDAAGNRLAPDNVWNDSPVGIFAAGGGGPSHVFDKPFFQYPAHTGFRTRSTPDISLTAAVDGGAIVYSTYPDDVYGTGYGIVGGTSEATPMFSGVVAIADQVAGHRLGDLNPRLYGLGLLPSRLSGIVDITKGDNTYYETDENGNVTFEVPGYRADRGYDAASGLGTVDAARFTHALAFRR
jgi:subtilase family serine protease